MSKKKTPKPDKPPAQMSEAERMEEWRRKRAQRGSLEKPGGKKGGSK